MRIFFSLFVILTISASAFGEGLTLRQQYLDYSDAMLSSSFEFKCGDSTFKLQKKAFKGSTLYWKSDLEWIEMSELKLMPTGISFEGLGIKGNLAKEVLKLNIKLPLYNHPLVHYDAKDFFKLEESSTFNPFSYSIDFYSGTLTQHNKYDIPHTLYLDAKKYFKTQSIVRQDSTFNFSRPKSIDKIEAEVEIMRLEREKISHSLLSENIDEKLKKAKARLLKIVREEEQKSINEKRKFEQLNREREEEIKDYIERYQKGVNVVVKAGEYSESRYCYLIQ